MTRKIRIRTSHGFAFVGAVAVFGAWAVHPAYLRWGYDVTMIGTGRNISRLAAEMDLADAKRVARALARAGKLRMPDDHRIVEAIVGENLVNE